MRGIYNYAKAYKDDEKGDFLWAQLLKWYESNQTIMTTTAVKRNEGPKIADLGIGDNHALTISRLAEIEQFGIRLICIRNPHGPVREGIRGYGAHASEKRKTKGPFVPFSIHLTMESSLSFLRRCKVGAIVGASSSTRFEMVTLFGAMDEGIEGNHKARIRRKRWVVLDVFRRF